MNLVSLLTRLAERALGFLQHHAAFVTGILAILSSPMGGASWQHPMVIAGVQWILGRIQKLIPNHIWDTRIVPIANYLIGVMGFQLVPLPAHAGVGDHVSAVLFNPWVMSLVTTVLTSGTQSIAKNTKQLAREWLIDLVQRKAAEYQSASHRPHR